MPILTVNGTELYHEVRGTGPPLLLILGVPGDGGAALWWAYFDVVAPVGERRLRTAEGLEQIRLARDAYTPDPARH
jgi:alkanesulfonate monooxygenase SsuD/methylene tetrahydromethanopterin reductase-like flavin-dependent oxidoreductase (luciferase family)